MPFRGTTRDEAVDEFDEYDPKPYSGGYDISLTYGRPLLPSEDTCHPLSSLDNERPMQSSEFDTSAFEAEYGRKGDCYGLLPPGFKQPPETDANYPNYGHVKRGEYESEYGSSYGGRTQPQECGSGYDGRTHPQEYRSEYGSGRNPQHGSGYGRQESYGYGASVYGRSEVEGYARQGYGGSEPIYCGGESGEGHGNPNYGVDYDAEKKYHHEHHHHQHHHRHHGHD
ncbi:hypothetical protein HPP92_014871 [Vanilla planifolia]|uniref:Uncharacterized protein n=1 Tax=Vanilla planifolia TaxID=51239 RepID=A0A835QRU4_VANPL|nr:hypothetical protein HPP92_014871 [Vanilla planifolia]